LDSIIVSGIILLDDYFIHPERDEYRFFSSNPWDGHLK